ncbi:sarcoplasmic reticulum histidine-rich calcium-binding protein-like isoform X2 [Schistocerca gregaria]|uniref:sarcoplasmic reticulum histidine-rich calcium-binding protein-like isoform X2 n=1 Tax=Schistocerca gregaria TaxID=7010 RepID=UPI00211E7B0B|nr:sarcoplasmic reticulum histidine-rich calcium-binding protein-like isoform X2 [Schistocerca gregaria]
MGHRREGSSRPEWQGLTPMFFTVFEAGRASLLALEAEKKSVPEEFRCSMCQNVFKKPMRVPCCSAVFCQACIEPSTSADPVQCPICRKVSLFERLVADEELELSIERWRRDREGREDEPPRAEGVEPGRSTELEKPQVDDGGSLLLPAGTGGATVSNCVAESINVKRPPKIKRPPPPPRQVGIAEAAINSKAQQGESDGASEKKREGEEVQNLSSSAQVASSPIDGSKDEPKDGSKDEPGDGSGDALRREEDAGKESREAERRLPGPSSDEGRRKGWRASRDSSSRRKGRKRSSSPDAFMDSSDSQLTEEGSSAKRRRRLSGSPEVEGHRHRYRDEEKRRIEREDGHYGRVEEVKRALSRVCRKRRHYGDDYYRHEECLYEGEHDYRYHRLRRDEELLESENHRGRCCYVGASSSNVSSHRYREDEAAPCHHHECDCRRYRDSDSSHRHHHRHSPSRQHSAHGNHECHCRHWSGYHRYHDAEHYYDDPSGHEKEEDQPRGGEDKKKKRKKRHGRRDNQNAAHVADDPKYSADVFDDGNRYAVESKADDVVSTDPTVSSANRVARKSRKEDVPRKRASTTRPGELARDGACSSSNNGRCTEEQHRPQHHRDAPSVDHPSDQGNPKPASARNPPKQTKKKKSRSSHRRGRRRSRAHSSSHKTNDKNNNNKRLRTSHP